MKLTILAFTGKNSLESMTSFYRGIVSESMYRQRSVYFNPRMEILVDLKHRFIHTP